MNDTSSFSRPREFRLKRGAKLLALYRAFSATEKAVFIVLVGVALFAALGMAGQVNGLFLVSVPAQGGSLTEGEIGVPRTANPILAVTDADKDVVALTYAGLLRRGADGKLAPDLAESYSISPDGLTYAFTLRSGLRFDDGAPITAADVVFTVNKTQDAALKSPLRANWADVTATSTSPNVVEFILKKPYAPFLANATLGILPEHVWQGVSDDQFIFDPYNIDPVGDGPYRVKSVSKDGNGVPTSYTLVPSGSYAGPRPFLGSIVLDFYPDEERAFNALEAGEIGGLASIDPADAAVLASSSLAEKVYTTPVPRLFGIFFNQNQNPVFADKAVREALSMSVDRAALVREVLDGYGVPVFGPVPVGVPGSDDEGSSTADIAGAQALLAKDGWKLGTNGVYSKAVGKSSENLSFSIDTADSPDLKAAADLLAKEWQTLGAQVAVNVYQYDDLQNAIASRSYDSLLFGEYVGTDLDLYAFWDSSQRNAPGLNVAEYVSSKADSLLSDARTATSSAERLQDVASFAGVFAEDAPAVFLYSPDFIYALPPSVKGVDVSHVSMPSDRWNGVSGWYVATDRVWSVFAGDGRVGQND